MKYLQTGLKKQLNESQQKSKSACQPLDKE